MKTEHQEQLFNRYPKIFAQHALPMTETAMNWGIECGDGWYTLIDTLCGLLQHGTDRNGAPQVEATQVKEKFGALRFLRRQRYRHAMGHDRDGRGDVATHLRSMRPARRESRYGVAYDSLQLASAE